MSEKNAVPGADTVACHRCQNAVGWADQYCVRCGLYEPQRTCRFGEMLCTSVVSGLAVTAVSFLGLGLIDGRGRGHEIADIVGSLAWYTWVSIILPTTLASYVLQRLEFRKKQNRRA